MKRYRIIVRIFVAGERSPTLTHIFHGRTQREAKEVFVAHQGVDSFLTGCLQGRFGRVACTSEVWMEDTVTNERWDVDD